MTEPTVYELSSPGRVGFKFPEPDVEEVALPVGFRREDLPSQR